MFFKDSDGNYYCHTDPPSPGQSCESEFVPSGGGELRDGSSVKSLNAPWSFKIPRTVGARGPPAIASIASIGLLSDVMMARSLRGLDTGTSSARRADILAQRDCLVPYGSPTCFG